MVAQAAPAISILNPKIKMGSSMVFNTAPAKVENMAYFGFPSARIKWLAPVVKIKNGKPMVVIRV